MKATDAEVSAAQNDLFRDLFSDEDIILNVENIADLVQIVMDKSA